MGLFDSALIADLVGIYILDTLGGFLALQNVEIYREDGLISIPNGNGPYHQKYSTKVIRALTYTGLETWK